MQEAKKTANRMLAEKMIEKLKLRRMEGFYVETKEEALALVKEKFLTQGKSVCYGGSVTLQETGIMDWLKESPCDVIDRAAFSTPEEEKEIKVTFPEEYHEESLKGKEATFKVKVHEIKTKEKRELDQDFFDDLALDGVNDEKSLKEEVKKNILAILKEKYGIERKIFGK